MEQRFTGYELHRDEVDTVHRRARYATFLHGANRDLEALPELNKGIQLAPDNYSLYRDLAASYIRLSRADDAIAALQRSLEIRPTASAYSSLATLYYSQGRYTDSAATFEKAVAIDAGNRSTDSMRTR